MSGGSGNGYFAANLPAATFPLSGAEALPASTNLAGGVYPQDEAITVDQLSGNARAVVVLTDAATITSDSSLLNNGVGTVTLAGNRTLANPTNLQPGQRWQLIIKQDATGNRTLAYGNKYLLVGGSVVLSTAASAIDRVTFTSDGTNVYVDISKAYA